MAKDKAYQIIIAKNAKKDFEKYLKSGNSGFKQAMRKLLENPKRAGKPLDGNLRDCYKIRKDPFRFVYRINEQTMSIELLAIQTRDDVYVEIDIPKEI